MKLYSIKDLKGDFSAIFCFSNDEVAVRSLPFIIEGNQLYTRYPEDFALYCVGEFDFKSGQVVANATPVFVAELAGKEKIND